MQIEAGLFGSPLDRTACSNIMSGSRNIKLFKSPHALKLISGLWREYHLS